MCKLSGDKENERPTRISWTACIVGKIVMSRMKRAGHIVRMKDEIIPKIFEPNKQEGCSTRGRPQLRWEDSVKRDLSKAEEEKWRGKANKRDQ